MRGREKADRFRQDRNLAIGCACHGRQARDDRWVGSTLGRGRAEARPYDGKGKRKKSGHNVPAAARKLRYCAPTRQESEIRTQKLEIRKSKLEKRNWKREPGGQTGLFFRLLVSGVRVGRVKRRRGGRAGRGWDGQVLWRSRSIPE